MEHTTDVLVAGGGPVGLVLAALLADLGVRTTVVERRVDVQPAPAAHVVNARTFEILRSLGVDAARLDAACQPPADGAWVRWVDTLAGREHGCVPFERQLELDTLDDVTPTPLRNLSQHRLEPILRDHLVELPSCAAWYGAQWRSAQRCDHGFASTVRDSDGVEHVVRSRYLVGADGAGSAVRKWCGIAMDGPDRLASIVAIHLQGDLRAIVGERPATLYWTTDPANEGVFVAHDIDRTWVFMHPYDPDTEQVADYTFDRCRQIVERAIGVDADFDVMSVSPWNMTCQVAERYAASGCFLVGDAAHRFPPTGGLGLNTGVADAHNLAWKVAAVERGWAPASLLVTYERERRPVAEQNAARSLENAVGLLEVQTALAAGSAPGAVRAAIAAQAGHFDMLGLQLGAVYGSDGALVDDGTPLDEAENPVRDYGPSTRPGGRLPHAWIDEVGVRRSTLDLVRPGRFLLLTANPKWAEVAEGLAGGAVPLDVWCGPDVLGVGDGALLVRPDQHIAWRTTAAPDDGTDLLDAWRRVLRQSEPDTHERSGLMPITTIDPPELAAIPGSSNVSIATGTRIVHIAGQTGVDAAGVPVGSTLAEQTAQALRNLRTAIEAAGGTLADIAMIRIYVVDYGPDSLDAIIGAAVEVYGDDFPVTASTLLGVATLFQPELLIEIDAMAVL